MNAPFCQKLGIKSEVSYHYKDPMVWWSMNDLFKLCGPMLTALVAFQIFSCLSLTHFAMKFTEVNHQMVDGALIAAVLTIDCVILACRRGRHYKDLWRPLFVWNGLLTVLPGVLALIWIKLGELTRTL